MLQATNMTWVKVKSDATVTDTENGAGEPSSSLTVTDL